MCVQSRLSEALPEQSVVPDVVLRFQLPPSLLGQRCTIPASDIPKSHIANTRERTYHFHVLPPELADFSHLLEDERSEANDESKKMFIDLAGVCDRVLDRVRKGPGQQRVRCAG